MKFAVVSIGSFDTQYSDYHLMRDILLEILGKGHHVVLIQKQYFDIPNYPTQFEPYWGKQLKVYNIRFEKKKSNNLKVRYLADILYYAKACKLLRTFSPQAIFLQSNNTAFYTVFYARHILKCPVLYNEQDIFPENALYAGILTSKSLIYRIAHLLQWYTYKNVAALSTISEDMKATIVTKYGIPPSKVEVIYNWGHEGLGANEENKNSFLIRYPKRKNEFRVVYAGNLGKMQNVELILRTAQNMKTVSDVTFYIVGGGVNKEALLGFAEVNQLENVKFVDMQPPEEVADLYASADVNLIPLKKGLIYAALPSKTADCLLANKPIITCVDKESSFAELMRSYGFQNASPDSPQELEKCILQLKVKSNKSERYTNLWRDKFCKDTGATKYCEMLESISKGEK